MPGNDPDAKSILPEPRSVKKQFPIKKQTNPKNHTMKTRILALILAFAVPAPLSVILTGCTTIYGNTKVNIPAAAAVATTFALLQQKNPEKRAKLAGNILVAAKEIERLAAGEATPQAIAAALTPLFPNDSNWPLYVQALVAVFPDKALPVKSDELRDVAARIAMVAAPYGK